MHRHEMQELNIYLNMWIIEYYSFWKNRVLQTYPLRMNLVPEIRTDQKRNMEILPSNLLLFPMQPLPRYGGSIAPCTS
jgi:hypothetical protein